MLVGCFILAYKHYTFTEAELGKDFIIYNIYHMPGTVFSPLYIICKLFNLYNNFMQWAHYCYLSCTEEEIEAQRD